MERELKLKSPGVKFIRFEDFDVKRNMNDVLRALSIIISEIEESEKT